MPLFSPFFRLPGRWRRRRARRSRMVIQVTMLSLILILVLPVYLIYKPPGFVIDKLQRRFPQVLFKFPTTRKLVALTIDDTPSEYTAQILDVLQANGAAATFFTIGGQISGREKLLEDILRSESELGNHAMHDEPSINLPSTTLRAEIHEVDARIDDAYRAVGQNRTSHYFRPGSGFFSQRMLDVAAGTGYKTILGSIYPHDPFIPYWRINSWHILSSLRPGAVIICHDRRPWTVPMLKKVVPEIRKRGYEIVTISGLLASESKT